MRITLGTALVLWWAFCFELPGQNPGPRLELSLGQAVERALGGDGNAQARLAREEVSEAWAQADQRRAALLPHLVGVVDQRRSTRNLEALGLRPSDRFAPPKLVGPISTFDARAGVEQRILDLSALRGWQASRKSAEGTESERERVEQEVAAQVARLYLSALNARADLEAVRADVELAESLLGLAMRQRRAGTGIRIEETRARVQLANERQRELVSENLFRRAKLRLLRTIAMPLNTDVRLTDSLEYEPAPTDDFQQARRTAFQSRRDLLAQQQRERAAELNYRAARMARIPSLTGFADYGNSGIHPNDSIPTWTAGVIVSIPLFDGGNIEARLAEQRVKLRQERIRSEDLRRQIELEVRLALTGVQLASEQVEVSRRGLDLAKEEVERAQRRYRAGVVNSIEPTDAQSRLARARENHNSALFQYNLARIDLAQAMGTIREEIR